MVSIVVLAYLAALVFDFRPRLSQSPKGEKVLYLLLMAVSLVPLLLNTLNVPIPSPAKPIEQAVKALFRVQ